MTVRELITKIGFKVDEAGAQQAEKRVQGMSTVMKTALAGIVAGVGAIGVYALKAAGDMEMLTTQFEVMLGSSEKAVSMMNQLKDFAAKTPFALEDLAKGAQQLLSFGVAQENVISTMRMLGDTAGGNAEKLSTLVLAYGKVTTKGKASLEEINMMAERGLPIFDVLSQHMGTSREELFKLISTGKVASTDITAAFQIMTSEGGTFFKGMERQSLTFQGLISTLKDNLKLMAASIGETLLPMAKQIIVTFNELVQGPIGDLVRVLVGSLAPVIESVANLFKKTMVLVTPITKIFETLIPIIITLLGVFDSLTPILDVVAFILSMIGDVLAVLSGPLNEVIKLLSEFIGAIFKIISFQLIELLKPVSDILIGLSNILGELLTALTPILKIMTKMWSLQLSMSIRMMLLPLKLIASTLAWIINLLQPIISGIGQKLVPIFEKFYQIALKINQVINTLFTIFEYVITQLLKKIQQVVQGVWEWIFGIVNKGISKVTEWIQGIGNTASSVIQWISQIFQQFWQWILNQFPGLAKVIMKIGEVFNKVWESVGNFFKGIWDAIIGAVQNLIEWVNKIPGVDIKLSSIEGGGAPTTSPPGDESLADFLASNIPSFSPAVTEAGKTANVNMENSIVVNVPPGSNTEGIKQAVQQAARSAFSIELQRILINAGY